MPNRPRRRRRGRLGRRRRRHGPLRRRARPAGQRAGHRPRRRRPHDKPVAAGQHLGAARADRQRLGRRAVPAPACSGATSSTPRPRSGSPPLGRLRPGRRRRRLPHRRWHRPARPDLRRLRRLRHAPSTWSPATARCAAPPPTENPALFWGLRGGKGTSASSPPSSSTSCRSPRSSAAACSSTAPTPPRCCTPGASGPRRCPSRRPRRWRSCACPPCRACPSRSPGRSTVAVRFAWVGDPDEGRAASCAPMQAAGRIVLRRRRCHAVRRGRDRSTTTRSTRCPPTRRARCCRRCRPRRSTRSRPRRPGRRVPADHRRAAAPRRRVARAQGGPSAFSHRDAGVLVPDDRHRGPAGDRGHPGARRGGRRRARTVERRHLPAELPRLGRPAADRPQVRRRHAHAGSPRWPRRTTPTASSPSPTSSARPRSGMTAVTKAAKRQTYGRPRRS